MMLHKSRQADAPEKEIEITEAMVRAGVEELREYVSADEGYLVRNIYRAMLLEWLAMDRKL